ncbi:MAG: VWA domain-containing protein [Planctomycetota bacterium]
MFLAVTFLAPIAGIIAGAIAVPLLVSLYFLKLRRRPVRVSSTLLWKSAVKDLQVNTPFQWIKFNWMLLLQLLIVILLVLAIARPAMDLEQLPSERVIVVIDGSASMGARDAGEDIGGESRLDRAKMLARELVRRATNEGAEVMVISFGSEARTLTTFTGDGGQAEAAIEAINQSDQEGRLIQALRVVEAYLLRIGEGGEGASEGGARVVVISDGQADPDRSSTVVQPSLRGAEVTFLRVGPEEEASKKNLGIVALAARRDYEDPGTVRVFVRVQNASDLEGASVIVGTLDGSEIYREAFSLGGNQEWADSFSIQTRVGGLLEIELDSDDALASDNRASLVIEAVDGARIAVVQPGAATTASEYALRDVLAALEPAELRAFTETEYTSSAGAEFWARFDLIVFDRVKPEQLPTTATLSFGAGLPIPGLLVGVSEEFRDRVTPVSIWQRTHPVMRYVTLGDVRIGSPFEVGYEGDENANVVTEELASGPAGALVMLVEAGGLRRLVVGTDLGRSNWWRELAFPVFMANAVDFLTLSGESAAGRGYRTNEAVVVGGFEPGIEVSIEGGPDEPRTVAATERGEVRAGVFEQVGVYQIGSADSGLLIGVNLLSVEESKIDTSEQLDVAGADAEAAGLGAAAPREIWRWFVLVAMVLGVIEWWLYARQMRV